MWCHPFLDRGRQREQPCVRTAPRGGPAYAPCACSLLPTPCAWPRARPRCAASVGRGSKWREADRWLFPWSLTERRFSHYPQPAETRAQQPHTRPRRESLSEHGRCSTAAASSEGRVRRCRRAPHGEQFRGGSARGRGRTARVCPPRASRLPAVQRGAYRQLRVAAR